ncbi:MAG: Pyrophosphate--fructose 6-phosphate 1-phosphotransferase [candidate division BRC1 bacterium ADurb.BinA364]|nr:MAG: Pyrophosphate--fructose 6-phosphate 1-phosphotransferase [candidate division BRC1 bacterium ADurb.BinA364]
MAWNLVGKALIGQSGGPTAVINQSLVGAVRQAYEHKEFITRFYGAKHGVRGILKEDFIDLYAQDPQTLDAVAETPSAALGSVRHKVTADECKQVFEICKKNDIRYFFYIGGNDSAETAHLINQLGREAGYELRLIHIPKTIDNDLKVTDHCPGYGSAAKFVAQAFMGDDLDNRSINGIKINIVMGRHAGFLTAASALGRKFEDDGPHLIYVPEVNFSMEKFLKDVEDCYARLGRCIVAVSEGVSEDGEPVASKFLKEVDSHGNVQLSGSGALGDYLAEAVKKHMTAKLGKEPRIRADTFGYLQRCFPGIVSEVDAKEAYEVGRAGVRFALSGDVDGSAVIKRLKGEVYRVEYELAALEDLAKYTKSMPPEFINASGNDVTQAFIDYALPLIGKLPVKGRLNNIGPK